VAVLLPPVTPLSVDEIVLAPEALEALEGLSGLILPPHSPSLSSSKSSSLPQPLLPSWSSLSTPPDPPGLSVPS
jgi:hypothetical protein